MTQSLHPRGEVCAVKSDRQGGKTDIGKANDRYGRSSGAAEGDAADMGRREEPDRKPVRHSAHDRKAAVAKAGAGCVAAAIPANISHHHAWLVGLDKRNDVGFGFDLPVPAKTHQRQEEDKQPHSKARTGENEEIGLCDHSPSPLPLTFWSRKIRKAERWAIDVNPSPPDERSAATPSRR